MIAASSRRALWPILVAFLLGPAAVPGSDAAVFTVTSALDDGGGSLRQAIRDANAAAGTHTITFAISDQINLSSPLPILACDVAIVNDNVYTTVTGPRLFESAPGHTITISGLRLEFTSDPTGGSAVLNRGGTMTVRNCFFWSVAGFAVKNTAGPGESATMNVDKCTFVMVNGANGAIDNTGAGSATLVATNSTFNGGLHTSSNEAVHNSGSATLTNCTWSLIREGQPFGTGIHNDGPAAFLDLRNCTLVGKSTDSVTVLLYNNGGSGTFANNIFKGGGSVTSLQNVLSGPAGFTSAGHNISSDAAGGDGTTNPGGLLNGPGDMRNTDPLLDSELYDNGGATQTHALLAGSPAINQADTTKASPRDQRNYIRSDAADIGAYERGATIPAALANISTRAAVGTGDDVLIAGVIGTTSRSPDRVIFRAIGPSLPISGALADPQIEVRTATGGLVAMNDNWQDAPNKDAIINTGIAPSHPAESAVLAPIATTSGFGSYGDTAQVRGANNSTGIALVEIYDLDRISAPKFRNLSTRGLVQTGNNVLIAGFIVLGPDSLRVVVRGIGPSLRFAGLGQVLEDPAFTVYDQNGSPLAANDNWRIGGQETDLFAKRLSPSNDLEAAAIATFAPGPYTAVMRGVNNTTGVGLVELYRLD